jgi:trehalose 6-phosphate synthase/phosphatase
VAEINEEYGSLTWTPVHFLTTDLSFVDTVALYRAADVALITPLRDGMYTTV